MDNFFKRAVTGVIIVAVIACSLVLGPFTFFILCCGAALFGLDEFYRLFDVRKSPLRVAAGLLLCVTLFATVFLLILQRADWRIWLINLPLVSFIFLTVLLKRSENPFSELAFTFLGQVYITLPFLLLFMSAFTIDNGMFHADVILGYFFVLWANDTGAYLGGSSFGKNLLAPLISPKKTWEGSASGALLAFVLAFINYSFIKDLSLVNWMVVSVMVIIMGTLGDLVKSVMKRSLGVKDSGTILPGHGGILDRFDSMIGSVPFVYAYLSLID